MVVASLLLTSHLPTPAYVGTSSTVAGRTAAKIANAPRWKRGKGLAALRAIATAPALAPAPGPSLPWEPAFPVYKGQADLATGNLLLVHSVTKWNALGPGVGLSLAYNSQSTRSGALGTRWTHGYEARISGTSPATVIRGDGREISYSLVNGAYVAPAGFQETLVRASNGTWTLTFKDGSLQRFDATGRLTSLEDANGNATVLAYSAGLLASVTDAAGRSLTLSYTNGKLTSVGDPEGRLWGFGYNSAGRLTSIADPAVDGVVSTTSFAYDANGLVSSVTNRMGQTWSYAYGASGVFATVTDPSGNAAGMATTAPTTQDANSYSSSSQSVATPDTVAPSYPVDTVSTAYAEDAGGNAREYGVDSQGRITAERDGSGAQTNYAWDAANNQTQIVEPGGATTTMTYDARANQTSVTDPTNRTMTRTYDARNNVLTSTDSAGKTTTNAYDVHNNLLSTTDPTNRTETRSYNANGALATVTDGAGKTTSYAYGAAGDVTSVTDPLGNVTSYTYALGRVTQRTDALGRQTAYTYDPLKRLKTIDYPQSADQSFTYDKEGRMTSSIDGTGARTYTYDALGRKIQQVDPRGTTTATYDTASRLTSQTDPTGRLIQYGYDGNGQITALGDGTSFASYAYDARRRLTQVTYSNGVVTLYGYDAAGRTTSTTHKTSGGTTIASDASSYDTAGRLTQSVEGPSSATTAYTYDDAGRLLAENRTGANPYASSYTYNSVGLRATAVRSENGVTSHNGTYTYDDARRLTNVTDTVATSGLGGSYAWNADGTLASMPANGYRRVMTYDEEGRLTGISKLQNGATTALYQYGYGFDGNRRWRKDLAANVWDWYPCGVACCAGELVTLRSTNGGATWTTLERKLAKGSAQFVDGSELLAPTASGTQRMQGTSETAVADGFGVVRAGAFGTKLSSVYEPLRGDAGLEQSLNQVSVAPEATKAVISVAPALVAALPARNPCPPPVPGWWARRLNPWAHSWWCRAAAVCCSVAAGDDIDRIILCAAREVKCKANGGRYTF